MSNIASVYTAVSNYEPTGAATTRNIAAVQLAVRNADLPCRVLLPSTRLEADDVFVMLGNLQRVGWSIRDLCLWAPMGAGTGIGQYASSMLTYISSYLSIVKTGRNPATNCTIQGIEVQMGPVNWADKNYWAVDITLTVEEIL